MEDISSPSLRRRRAAFAQANADVGDALRGSLIERYKRCGKPGCKCAEGPGHGPKYQAIFTHPPKTENPRQSLMGKGFADLSHVELGVLSAGSQVSSSFSSAAAWSMRAQ